MKSFLVIAFLIASVSCIAQANTFRPGQFFLTTGDTVTIGADIRFVKIDGKVYEIKTTTTIEEAKPSLRWFDEGTSLHGSPIITTWTLPTVITGSTSGSITVPAIGVNPQAWK